MSYNANINSLVVAAHRGQQIAQQALAVIEDTQRAFGKSLRENHIIKPTEHDYILIWDRMALSLINSSPWLKASVEKYGKVDA